MATPKEELPRFADIRYREDLRKIREAQQSQRALLMAVATAGAILVGLLLGDTAYELMHAHNAERLFKEARQ